MPLSTTELCKRLDVTVTAEQIAQVGVKPAQRPEGKRAGTFWLESDIPAICRGIAGALELKALAEEERLEEDEDF